MQTDTRYQLIYELVVAVTELIFKFFSFKWRDKSHERTYD
jgi:hypothetical protein